MPQGRFITFEGTEGAGKTTQIELLTKRLREQGHIVRAVREPGGTPVGEEIRHTLKHSAQGDGMTPETELLLMNASRAQLVREVIRPALMAGEIVLCDRFYDSTVAYQGYGRRLNLKLVQSVIDCAVGDTRPDLTLLLQLPVEASENRRKQRQAAIDPVRDRFEESDREFFQRVERGFLAVAKAQPKRVKVIDATDSIRDVSAKIWKAVEGLFGPKRKSVH